MPPIEANAAELNQVWMNLLSNAIDAVDARSAGLIRVAIRHRNAVIRATTTGISAVIDPYGRITARTAFGRAEILTATVVPMQVATVYKRYGDVFAYLCACASLAALIALTRRRLLVDCGGCSAGALRDGGVPADAKRDAAPAR